MTTIHAIIACLHRYHFACHSNFFEIGMACGRAVMYVGLYTGAQSTCIDLVDHYYLMILFDAFFLFSINQWRERTSISLHLRIMTSTSTMRTRLVSSR